MSEVAESTAAAPAEAAAVVEAPVQTEAAQPTTAATENLSPRERARARGREIDRARTESERKAEQAREQARQGDGKFAKETDAAEPAAEAVAGEAPEVSESESPQAEATAQESDGGPAEGFERVQYPEGHPLRDQGVEYEDVPTALAPKFKALLNGTYARRQEVEQAQARALELEQRLLRMEAEARFQQEHGSEFWTAQDQEIYDALLEDERGGQTAAEAYKRGRQQEAESKLQAVREEADLQALSRQWQHNGKQFREEAHQSLPRLIPGLRAEEIDTAIGMYRAELEQVESMAWQQAQAAGIPRATRLSLTMIGTPLNAPSEAPDRRARDWVAASGNADPDRAL